MQKNVTTTNTSHYLNATEQLTVQLKITLATK